MFCTMSAFSADAATPDSFLGPHPRWSKGGPNQAFGPACWTVGPRAGGVIAPRPGKTPLAAPAATAQFRVDDLQELGRCILICRFLAIRQRLPELQEVTSGHLRQVPERVKDPVAGAPL